LVRNTLYPAAVDALIAGVKKDPQQIGLAFSGLTRVKGWDRTSLRTSGIVQGDACLRTVVSGLTLFDVKNPKGALKGLALDAVK
jgi:hypothetical protein